MNVGYMYKVNTPTPVVSFARVIRRCLFHVVTHGFETKIIDKIAENFRIPNTHDHTVYVFIHLFSKYFVSFRPKGYLLRALRLRHISTRHLAHPLLRRVYDSAPFGASAGNQLI